MMDSGGLLNISTIPSFLKRIDSYDGNNVTFHYNLHEDNAFVKRTLPAIDFIKLLIQHIPEKNFKMTRYYVLYSRHRALESCPKIQAPPDEDFY